MGVSSARPSGVVALEMSMIGRSAQSTGKKEYSDGNMGDEENVNIRHSFVGGGGM